MPLPYQIAQANDQIGAGGHQRDDGGLLQAAFNPDDHHSGKDQQVSDGEERAQPFVVVEQGYRAYPAQQRQDAKVQRNRAQERGNRLAACHVVNVVDWLLGAPVNPRLAQLQFNEAQRIAQDVGHERMVVAVIHCLHCRVAAAHAGGVAVVGAVYLVHARAGNQLEFPFARADIPQGHRRNHQRHTEEGDGRMEDSLPPDV